MPYQMIDNLRMVDFALYDGSNNSNFVPTPVPFDTNLVYVLPDTTNLKDNTIAVQSGVPVSGYRIGGVRPTFPDEGMVWMPLEDDKIADCQIYNGSYWESVGCRVWTGERWVPAWAFNVITLSDLWDMYGGEETDNYTEITPGSFFQWFQEQWYEFKTKLFELLGGGGGGSEPPSDCEHVYSSKITREPGCAQPGLKTYTCDKCKHSYTESIDATGHDWLTVDTVPEVLDEEGKVLEEGYDVLECSICGAESKDFGDGPVEEDLFDALGNFIADGITWILEKLTELADSLRAITDTFVDFTTRVGDLAGGFPLFFGAFVALIPEDLKTIMWFGLIGLIVLGVWKKWAR